MNAPELSNRVALVTGAGGGIGRAVAEALASGGTVVGVHCHRSLSEAEQVVEGILVRGGQAILLQGDLADPAQAVTLVERLVQQTGRLDILVNNAGSPIRRSRIEECALDLWQEVIVTNLTSAFLVTQIPAVLVRREAQSRRDEYPPQSVKP